MASTPYQTIDPVRRPGVYWVGFLFQNTAITAADILLDFVPGHNFKVVGSQAVASTVASTTSKAATVSVKVDGTTQVGASLALTTAGLAAVGQVVAGAAVADANMLVGTPTSKIRLTGSSVTAFVEGATMIYLAIQNLDSAA